MMEVPWQGDQHRTVTAMLQVTGAYALPCAVCPEAVHIPVGKAGWLQLSTRDGHVLTLDSLP